MQKISTCLWFEDQAEAAAEFYTSVFEDSKILKVMRYGEAGAEVSGRPIGSVMTVDFEINGQKFVALNGGPAFTFNESVSFMINCKTQEEIDYYWQKLSAVPDAEQCGWAKDQFGVSWQIVPDIMDELLSNPDSDKAEKVFQAMLEMKKLDIAKLERAAQS